MKCTCPEEGTACQSCLDTRTRIAALFARLMEKWRGERKPIGHEEDLSRDALGHRP